MNCKKCHSNLIVYLEGGLRESEQTGNEGTSEGMYSVCRLCHLPERYFTSH
jgi:RNase P subunit RPR2